jgi:DNA topoisomerase-3
LWVSALTDKALKAGFAKLRSNAEMKPLHEAGLARNHADWLYGMNLSRGVTLAADTTETFSYGRVQTPTLYLVVQREWDIRAFKQAKYYELVLKVKTAGGHELTLKHAPAADARITQKAEAERRMALVAGQAAPLKVTSTNEKDAPELPFNLPALQKEASTSLGLGASEVLAFLQSLYDKKIISYPRTDCRYLETGLQADVPGTLDSLAALFPEGVAIVKANGPLFRKNVFDDSKLTDHHGIIPTGQMMELSGMELRLFKIIAARYLQVLAPDARYELTKVAMDIKGVEFVTSGRVYTGKSFRDIKAN